ncbi:MAG: YraN family protein [Lachnospiraceae bacterium]|nr:YraN family protein [Lachnospiraceae bacterium]
MNKRKVGGRYEEAAALWLQKKGCRLLEKNFRIRSGEIDLIMEDGSTIVFVEVKFRGGKGYGSGEEHVGRRKQERIIRVARFFLLRYGLSDRYCRFDVISIDGQGRITHYENAFEITQE